MNNSNGVECLAWTWGIATLVGCFAAAALWGLGGWSFMQGAFMGVLCLLILGALLTLMMCRASAAPMQAGTAGVNRASAPAAPAVADTGAADRAAAAAEAEAARAAAAKADADAATKAQADADATAAKVQVEAVTATAATATPAVGAAGEGTRPEALDGPRGGQADDLKKIKGVGPKMETLCNSLGFYHFDQIAAWTPEEVHWVDQNLEGFKGRVTRDTWVDQARLLASGGETDFSKKVEGGDVY